MPESLLRLEEVKARTGLTRSALYRMIAAGEFPAGLVLPGTRTVAWVESEVSKWIEHVLATAARQPIATTE